MHRNDQRWNPRLVLVAVVVFVLVGYYLTAGPSRLPATTGQGVSSSTTITSSSSSLKGTVAPGGGAAATGTGAVSEAQFEQLTRRLWIVEGQLAASRAVPDPEIMDSRVGFPQVVSVYYDELYPSVRKRLDRIRAIKKYLPTEPVFAPLRDSSVVMVTPTLSTTRDHYISQDTVNQIQRTGVWGDRETALGRIPLQKQCIGPDGQRQLFVDVGGHIGYWSVLALEAGCDVLYVEPYVENQLWFRLSLARNGYVQANTSSAQAYIYNTLCSDIEDGPLYFNGWNAATPSQAKERKLHSDPKMVGQWATVAVSVDTMLSRLPPSLATHSIPLWKMDIEGHEPHGFASARKALASGRIHRLLFEMTYYLRAEINVIDALEALTFEYDFLLYELVDMDYLLPIDSDNHKDVWRKWHADAMEGCRKRLVPPVIHCVTNFYGHLRSQPSYLEISARGLLRPAFPRP